MGQRLVIQIEENGEPLANAYYHWSAYTETAIHLVNDILGYLDNADQAFTPKQKAAWALYMTGARFNSDEVINISISNIMKKDFEFVFDGDEVDRNKGLLSITPEGMDNNVNWEESHVSIDLADGEIYFGVMCEEPTAEWLQWNDDVNIDELLVYDPPAEFEMNVDQWYDFSEKVLSLCDSCNIVISSDRSTIYEFIQ